MAEAMTDQDDEQAQRNGAEQGRIDAMQRSLTRLHGDIHEQRHALQEGQREVAQQQRDVAVSEQFAEDLRQNIDGAQGRLDYPGAAGEERAPTPGPTRRPDPAGPKAEPPA
jgi:chromosome segregation ATPase